MKLAFCLFKYFPFGGLQRDFKRIAETCRNRGHSIHVFTMSWEGDAPPGFHISLIPVRAITNHQSCLNFSQKFAEYLLKENFDLVVGFNKMQGLNVYYAADPCYKARVMEGKGALYKITPRSRTYLALEKSVFDPPAMTQILLISETEKAKYIKYYNTPEERFHSLPPGISRDQVIHENIEEIREGVRNEFGVADDEFMLLMVGSGFKTKGLDRSLIALAGLPDTLRKKTKLLVIGEGKSKPFEKMAKRLKVTGNLFFLGGRDDVPRFMAGADLLLHPAYSENTGTVLIEAMLNGLPVLATDICGYSFYVKEAKAGLLIPSPFKQQTFNSLLSNMLTLPDLEIWKRNGLDYSSKKDFFSMPERASDIIESLAMERN